MSEIVGPHLAHEAALLAELPESESDPAAPGTDNRSSYEKHLLNELSALESSTMDAYYRADYKNELSGVLEVFAERDIRDAYMDTFGKFGASEPWEMMRIRDGLSRMVREL